MYMLHHALNYYIALICFQHSLLPRYWPKYIRDGVFFFCTFEKHLHITPNKAI